MNAPWSWMLQACWRSLCVLLAVASLHVTSRAELSTNVIVRYEGTAAVIDFSAASWRGQVEEIRLFRCPDTSGKAACGEQIQQITSFPDGTIRHRENGLFRIEFHGDLPWYKEWREVFWEQYFVNIEVPTLEIEELAKRHAPTFSFHGREEYFPVKVETLFHRPVSEFNTLGSKFFFDCGDFSVTDVCATDEEMADDFMRRNGGSELRLFLEPAVVREKVYGSRDDFPVYWFSQREDDGATLWITYFVLYAYDQKRPEYVVGGGLGGGVVGADHAVDRESITIGFSRIGNGWVPKDVIYAGHLPGQDTIFKGCNSLPDCTASGSQSVEWKGGKTRVGWANAAKDGDHPVAYIADGSHAVTPAFGYYYLEVPEWFNVTEPAGNSICNGLSTGKLVRLDLGQGHSALTFSGLLIDGAGRENSRVFPFVRYPIGEWASDAGEEFAQCVSQGLGCGAYVAELFEVAAITPAVATVGVQQSFVVSGANLPSSESLDISAANCVGYSWTSGSPAEHRFSCTPAYVGVMDVVVHRKLCTGLDDPLAFGISVTAAAQPPIDPPVGTVPVPFVSQVSPPTMPVNGVAQTLRIDGSGFSAGNVVQFKWGVGSRAGVWNNSLYTPTIGSNLITVSMDSGPDADTIYVRVCRSASQTTASDCSSSTAFFVSVTPAVVTPPTGAPSQTASITQVYGDVGATPVLLAQGSTTADPTPEFIGTLSAPLSATQTLRVFNGTNILGAAAVSGTTWTFTPTALANGTYSFTAAVVSADGIEGTRSSAWNLTINTTAPPPTVLAPSISSAGQPTSATVTAGQTATFTVFADGTGPFTYQWRRDGVALSGATAQSYTTPTTKTSDNGAVYSVVVSNAAGTAISNNATLTVTPSPYAVAIVIQPADVTVNVGQAATFSVTAVSSSGAAPLGYQWSRSGVEIPGATAMSYTTPRTTTSDDGAQYSVVVSNNYGSVTSRQATLTVVSAQVGAGYYLVASAGPFVFGDRTDTWANYSARPFTDALIGVSTQSGAAVIIEPAGQWSRLREGDVNVDSYEASIDPTTRQVSNFRTRFSAYAKNGHFYKVDHNAGQGGPGGQQLSTQNLSEVCTYPALPSELETRSPYIRTYVNYPDGARAYLVYVVAGPDGQCGTMDDGSRAVRFDMSATDPPLTVPKVATAIYGAAGALSGFIVQSGGQYQRVDVNFANPVPVTGIASAQTLTFATGFGYSFPGYWIFLDGAFVKALDLAGSSGAITLFTLNVGERLVGVATDGAAAYVALNSGTSTRVIRLDYGLSVQTLATVQVGSAPAGFLALTPTRVILMDFSSVQAIPITGGAAQTIATAPRAVMNWLATSGENVYINSQDGTGQTVRMVRSDGSAVQDIDGAQLIAPVAPPAIGIERLFGNPPAYGFVIADGWTTTNGFAGGALRLYEGATRNVQWNYGSFPVSPGAYVSTPSVSYVLQYGQYSLVSMSPLTPTDTGGNSDLYLFKTDGQGLTRVTNFLSALQ